MQLDLKCAANENPIKVRSCGNKQKVSVSLSTVLCHLFLLMVPFIYIVAVSLLISFMISSTNRKLIKMRMSNQRIKLTVISVGHAESFPSSIAQSEGLNASAVPGLKLQIGIITHSQKRLK